MVHTRALPRISPSTKMNFRCHFRGFRYDDGFGSHLEDGPCDLHDSSGRHSKSQQKCDSARTDEDEAFKEQDDIEDPFQPDTVCSI